MIYSIVELTYIKVISQSQIVNVELQNLLLLQDADLFRLAATYAVISGQIRYEKDTIRIFR